MMSGFVKPLKEQKVVILHNKVSFKCKTCSVYENIILNKVPNKKFLIIMQTSFNFSQQNQKNHFYCAFKSIDLGSHDIPQKTNSTSKAFSVGWYHITP